MSNFVSKDATAFLTSISDAFAIKESVKTDELFKSATIGLISGEAFQQKRSEIANQSINQNAETSINDAIKPTNQPTNKKPIIKRKANISFNDDDDESEEFAVVKKPTIKDIKKSIENTVKTTINQSTNQSINQSNGNPTPVINGSPISEKQEIQSINQSISQSDENESIILKKSISKNPDVATDFLPDVARSLYEQSLRATLSANQSINQSINQSKPMKITYSYWSGTGHRRVTTINQGASISQFLRQVYKELTADGTNNQSFTPSNSQFNQRFNKLFNNQSNQPVNNSSTQSFPELRHCSIDDLMLIKEDLIIPHHLTFYQLIVCQARGKSGPLFDFDVHEDVRLLADANNQSINTHAAKVCTKHWFERNKHIFPANRWEVFDMNQSRTDNYTIKGKEVR